MVFLKFSNFSKQNSFFIINLTFSCYYCSIVPEQSFYALQIIPHNKIIPNWIEAS